MVEEHGCFIEGWHEVVLDCLILYRSSNPLMDQCQGSEKEKLRKEVKIMVKDG